MIVTLYRAITADGDVIRLIDRPRAHKGRYAVTIEVGPHSVVRCRASDKETAIAVFVGLTKELAAKLYVPSREA